MNEDGAEGLAEIEAQVGSSTAEEHEVRYYLLLRGQKSN